MECKDDNNMDKDVDDAVKQENRDGGNGKDADEEDVMVNKVDGDYGDER